MNAIETHLKTLADPTYCAFQARLIPTVDPARILGVRIPDLRRYARSIYGTAEAAGFLSTLPHTTYDADNLHACLLSMCLDRAELRTALERFLPYIDNWATCDILRPVALARDIPALRLAVADWIADPHPYTCRFAVEMLMTYCLGDHFLATDLAAVADVATVRANEYYINMMCAWYFATALAAQPDETLPYFTEWRLEPSVLRRAIQKSIESRRIPAEQKEMLRALRKETDAH